jgi:uncharacterized membrane protein
MQPRAIHPLHAVLLAGTVPLFLATVLSDLAYSRSYEIQWLNFSSWLIVGGLSFCGLALLWSLVELLRGAQRTGRPLVYFLLLLTVFVVGLFNAFQHARDAWATMPGGLVRSIIVTVLAIAATWVGFARLRNRGVK